MKHYCDSIILNTVTVNNYFLTYNDINSYHHMKPDKKKYFR